MMIQSRPWCQSKSLQCWLCFVAAVLFQGIGLASIVRGQGTSGKATTESKSKEGSKKLEKATFGGGCFWCTEAVFQRVKGVKTVVSGYTGGTVDNPTYEQVCTGTTGHAEVIQIEFDPEVVAFAKLLEVHWKTHDPTTLNKQGYDEGTQYRSAIFYAAEKYHQNYFNLNARKNPYCQAVIVPKLKKFDEVFDDIKKDDIKK